MSVLVTLAIILFAIILALAIFSFFDFVYIHGDKYDCDKTVYTSNLTLELLRNITSYCSDSDDGN